AFFADGKLSRLDIGGQPRGLATAPFGRGGTWNADGVILFTPNTGAPLFRAGATGGEAVAVTKLEKRRNERFPYFLPGGRQFLFVATGPPETRGIYLASLDSPEIRRLTESDTAGAYLAPGGSSGSRAERSGRNVWI